MHERTERSSAGNSPAAAAMVAEAASIAAGRPDVVVTSPDTTGPQFYIDACEHFGVREWGTRAPVAVRLLRLTKPAADGCWLWAGNRTKGGYGQIGDTRQGGKARSVHRVSYELFVGPIPDGLQLDHLCRVRHCLNPTHLEPVTAHENVIRSTGFPGVNARKTACPRGHAYSPENTGLYIGRSGRQTRRCLACSREWARNYQAERRLAARSGGN